MGSARRADPLVQLTRLQPSLTKWLRSDDVGCPTDELADALFASVQHIVAALVEANPWFKLTAWHSTDVDNLLDVVLVSDKVVDDDEVRQQIAGEADVFLVFLVTEGLWSGDDENLAHCRVRLAGYRGIGRGPDRGSETPDGNGPLDFVPMADEAAALARLPLMDRMAAFVDWLGAGRPVTGTGALKPALIPDLCTALGVAPARARSMWDVPDVSSAWLAAKWAELITVNSTSALPTPMARRLRAAIANPASHFELLQKVTTTAIVARLEKGSPHMSERERDGITTSVIDVLSAGLTRRLVALDPAEHAARRAANTGLSYGTAEEDLVFDGVDELVREGIMSNDGGYEVRDELKPAVTIALGILSAEILSAAKSPDPAVDTTPSAADKRYTVKVTLQDVEPPVWRRLVLDGDILLDDLHHAIHAALDWDNSHLHQFTVGPLYAGGTVYMQDVEALGDAGPGECVPEEAVPMSALLAKVGDTLTYLYDFGDDWIHEIRVEKIERAGGAVPRRCLAGEGAAPAEDSGGPHGWSMLVASANDPSADDHEHARDWLGVKPGKRFDPAHCDVAAVDRRLVRLLG